MKTLPAFRQALLPGLLLPLLICVSGCAATAQQVVVRPAPRPYYVYPVRPSYRPLYRRPLVVVVPPQPVIVAPAPPRYYYYNARPHRYIRVR